MTLTTAQKATFKTWLDANAPVGSFTEQQAADLANTLASPTYFVWLKTADKAVVDGQIVKANFTPTDAPPASGSTVQLTNDAMLFQNRALACQLKQANAQWLTSGPASISTIDARLAPVRQNFKDCLLAIPSGASGANQDAGWGTASVPGTVRLAMMRTVTNFEKLYVAVAAAGAGNAGGDARGLNTNPDILGTGSDGNEIVGPVTAQDISNIRGGL